MGWLRSVAIGAPTLTPPEECSRACAIAAAVAICPDGCDADQIERSAFGLDPRPVPVELLVFDHDELVAIPEDLDDAIAVVWFRLPADRIRA